MREVLESVLRGRGCGEVGGGLEKCGGRSAQMWGEVR